MTLTRRSLLVAGSASAAVLAVPGVARAAAPALLGRRTLATGRTYWLVGTGPALVVGLHGSGHGADSVNSTFWNTGRPETAGWQQHALATGYALALGEGVNGAWNVGGGWPSSGQDDLAYLSQVVSDARQVIAGPGENYVAGFSAGAAMAWRAVVDRPDLFAAGGSASGWASSYPDHPVDVLHYHGTGDTTVPIRGGAGVNGFTFPAASLEAERAPRGSRVVMYATSGGHAVPGWAAADLWRFFTQARRGAR